MSKILFLIKELEEQIDHLANSRERSLAMTKLDELRLWLNEYERKQNGN